jgi:hypothetical protein
MDIGDTFGNLEVVGITYRQRRDGTQGAPLLVDVRCKCGVEKTVQAIALTRTRCPQKSCGGKGCKKRGPSLKVAKPAREEWVCKRRGSVDGLL